VIVRRQLKWRYVLACLQKLPPCLVGIEAWASSHHWSRDPAQLPHAATLLHYVQPVRHFVGGAVWWSFRGKYSPTALDCGNETGSDPAFANVADQ
jgi:hypothetical protein